MPTEDVCIRAQYEKYRPSIGSTECGPGHNKVLARGKNIFVTSLPEKWKLDYIRRKGQCNTGLFSISNIPYKTFEDLTHLDIYDVLQECMGITINKKSNAHPQTQCYVVKPRFNNYLHAVRSLHTECAPIDSIANIVVVSGRGTTTKKFRNLPPSDNAGLEHISKKMASISRTIKDVKAGSSLRDALRQEDERQGVLQVIKAPKVFYQKGQEVTINKPCTHLPPMLPTASSKICLVTGPHLGFNSGWFEDTQKKMFGPDSEQNEDDKRFRAFVKKNCLAKLKSIYAILCCLHNIKVKDLRHNEILSFSTIKAISKHINPTQLSRDYHQQLYQVELLHQPHHAAYQQHYSNFSHHSNKCSHSTATDQRLSSWGDIADIHTATASPSTQRSRQHRASAAWKKKVVFIEDKESLDYDPTKSISDCIKSYDFLKRDVAQRIKVSLDDSKETREKNFALKMEHFEVGLSKDKCLNKMRRKTYEDRWAEKEQYLKKPEWLVLVEDEVKCVFEEQAEELEQGRSAVHNLSQFMYMDATAIPSVVEKLCLLVMSLPAHHLCVKQVILALKFVTEYFLKVSPNLIDKLRELRQLPLMAELHPPDYLFGMQIDCTCT